jgi:divalent metal cation (Fe/Co/Zn/Cd) transporter
VTASVGKSGSLTLANGLLWFTVAWNVVEGAIAVSSGVAAGSVALVGFGLDSFIEVTAALVLLWRLRVHGDDQSVERRERVAHRVVGFTFLALAIYICAESFYVLATRDEPDASTVGLVLAIVSLAVMPVLGVTKRRNATRLRSPALISESTETLICSYLSLTLFMGLAANGAFGWWWADVAAALAMAPWIVKEGIEGVRAEECGE